MKQKTLSLILALILMLTFGCAQLAFAESDATESDTAEGEEWVAPLAGEPITLEKDLGVLIEGVYYPVFQPVEALMEALGEPVDIVVSPSCVFEGEDFELDYEFGSLYTNPIDGADFWYEFYIFEPGMTTTRGLAVGDSVETMLELYGENYYSEGDDMYTYSLSGDPEDYGSPCLIFEAEDGLIVTIDIYYPTNI